ncbi:hypothetical protein GQ600_8012 [Phytophthora cactorum]|nr:hypothetical protein GQ600_8012 [Phytophthora cactorum]
MPRQNRPGKFGYLLTVSSVLLRSPHSPLPVAVCDLRLPRHLGARLAACVSVQSSSTSFSFLTRGLYRVTALLPHSTLSCPVHPIPRSLQHASPKARVAKLLYLAGNGVHVRDSRQLTDGSHRRGSLQCLLSQLLQLSGGHTLNELGRRLGHEARGGDETHAAQSTRLGVVQLKGLKGSRGLGSSQLLLRSRGRGGLLELSSERVDESASLRMGGVAGQTHESGVAVAGQESRGLLVVESHAQQSAQHLRGAEVGGVAAHSGQGQSNVRELAGLLDASLATHVLSRGAGGLGALSERSEVLVGQVSQRVVGHTGANESGVGRVDVLVVVGPERLGAERAEVLRRGERTAQRHVVVEGSGVHALDQ